MKKTYTQKVHYRIVIEGDYSISNLYEEELFNTAEETHNLIWGHVSNHICDYYPSIIMTLDNLRTEEEDK